MLRAGATCAQRRRVYPSPRGTSGLAFRLPPWGGRAHGGRVRRYRLRQSKDAATAVTDDAKYGFRLCFCHVLAVCLESLNPFMFLVVNDALGCG